MPRAHTLRTSLASLVLIASSVPALAQATQQAWVVDPQGGGDFTTIQAAVDAAQDGDVIFVRDGAAPEFRFQPFDVAGKGLVILAEEGTSTRTQSVTVTDLPAGSTVALVNLEIEGYEPPQAALTLADNAGAVLVQGCRVTGLNTHFYSGAGPTAVEVRDSELLVLSGTTCLGAEGSNGDFSDGSPGGAALLAERSAVAGYGCILLGGAGGGGYTVSSPPVTGGRGGAGARLVEATLWASESVFRGGAGGESCSAFFDDTGGDGGDGISADGASLAWVRACTLQGGVPGQGCGTDGVAGSPSTGAVTALPGPAWELSVPGTVREGAAVVFTLGGEPGASAFVAVRGTLGASTFAGPDGGWIHVRPDAGDGVVYSLGALPASGQLTRVRNAPQLPAGAVQLLYAQSAFRASGDLRLGPARIVVVLDAGL